ncbi:hypothetical protein [Flagellimonas zhangzhouensis]|uniref:Uncharacterized protein n=1 Tax=Flagellimonas zhangzhouensis TaxID=1073328 RepID=A0A1H2S4Z8_9FLAO|nr:hypothetical protein [Allomuricauda zhangzhouensis]SDQ70334.1 hypothetical protein SAMN05216294_2265 [Allomuricauda zhangzhouensis]SDW26234.1 hypothetical protein SAMN04487892_0912 [Allomuricauda zhangzhouensis]
MLGKTNIENILRKARNKNGDEAEILTQVEEILRQDQLIEEKISETLGSKNNSQRNNFDFDLLETSNIFHIDQIKQICIDYRLRFLDSSYFKGEIPQEAISKIKHLEAAHNTTVQGFKIMAPSRLFRLEDKDDPLLFAPIGNDYFYLIHKWGNDLHPLRRLFAWPFKNIVNLGLVVLAISYLVTLMVPEGLFSKKSTTAEFWIIYFFMFKCLASIVIFYGFALGKNFNPAIWKSKYFNA